MIGSYTKLIPRGWLPTTQSGFLSEQPIWYAAGTAIQDTRTGNPPEIYPFGATITSSYYSGPTAIPAGWDRVPHLAATLTWHLFGGTSTTSAVDIYFDVTDVAWGGNPPYSTASSAHSPPTDVRWGVYVDGVSVIPNDGPAIIIRSHVISNAHPQGTVAEPSPPAIYTAHTHDDSQTFTDRLTTILFNGHGVEYFGDAGTETIPLDSNGNPLPPIRVSNQPGDYLDHLEFLTGTTTIANWYPAGYPGRQPGVYPTTVHDQVLLADWEQDIVSQ